MSISSRARRHASRARAPTCAWTRCLATRPTRFCAAICVKRRSRRAMRIFSNRNRPVHLGRFPLERLPRAALDEATVRMLRELPVASGIPERNTLARLCREYCAIYERFRSGAPAAEKAPYLEDPLERAKELKSLAYFFDATMVATCAIPGEAWRASP